MQLPFLFYGNSTIENPDLTLPVKYLVQLFVRDIKSNIVRGQFFTLKITRKPVVGGVKAGLFVEFPFHGQNLFTQVHDIVTGHAQSVHAVDNIQHGIKGFLLIQDGKGDKQTETACIDGCGCDLEIPYFKGEFLYSPAQTICWPP